MKQSTTEQGTVVEMIIKFLVLLILLTISVIVYSICFWFGNKLVVSSIWTIPSAVAAFISYI